MTLADTLCGLGAMAVVAGLYLIHPAAAVIAAGALAVFLGIRLHLKRKDKPQ